MQLGGSKLYHAWVRGWISFISTSPSTHPVTISNHVDMFMTADDENKNRATQIVSSGSP